MTPFIPYFQQKQAFRIFRKKFYGRMFSEDYRSSKVSYILKENDKKIFCSGYGFIEKPSNLVKWYLPCANRETRFSFLFVFPKVPTVLVLKIALTNGNVKFLNN